MVDVDKVVEYWSAQALETLEYLRKQQAETRNSEVAKLVARNMEILCHADKLMEPAIPPAAAAAWDSNAAYADPDLYNDSLISNARGRGRHYVKAHYSYAMPGGSSRYSQHSAGTISRMMAAADPREKEILERLLAKTEE